MKYLKILVTALFGTLILPVTNVLACGCGGGFSAVEGYRGSAAVFVAKAVKVYQHPSESVSRKNPDGSVTVSVSYSGLTTTTLSVEKSYKGMNAEIIDFTDFAGDGCSFTFSLNETYLVYANLKDGKLNTHKCTKTRELSRAVEDIKFFEAALKKQPQAFIFGDAFREIILSDGNKGLQVPFEELQVIAESSQNHYKVTAEKWGTFQISVVPGEYHVWVERGGERVSEIKNVTAADGKSVRETLAAKFDKQGKDQ